MRQPTHRGAGIVTCPVCGHQPSCHPSCRLNGGFDADERRRHERTLAECDGMPPPDDGGQPSRNKKRPPGGNSPACVPV